ncbi:MAG: flagellar hook-associated protein FlgK [Burkholderiales bacterium]|nr:flagellar hook-associated protein FlgK [Burkholderiales bacterium]
MSDSVYNIAISGLRAAQIGLTTTSQNIANANTPGYTRQTIDQSAANPQPSGSGFIGNGVDVNTITRVYSQFLVQQMQSNTAQNGFLTNLQSHLSDLDNLLADPSAGFSPSLQDFFTGVQTVANNPTQPAARQSLIGLSQAMITKLQTVNTQLNQFSSDINTELTSTVGNINSITNQIANLNQQISLATGAGGGNQPNDLLDQRDQLVTQLNQYVKSTIIKQSDGSYNVFIGNGQNLVVGNQAFTLGAVPSQQNPAELDVAYQQFGATVYIAPNMLTGGSLGAALQYRDQLQQTQSAVGRVAAALGQTVNTQNKQGQDLNGQIGGNFFQFPVEKINTQTKLGANGVTLTSTNLSAQPFVASDFNVRLDAGSGNYIITRLTDGQNVSVAPAVMTSAAGQNAFGINFKLSANMVAGESFGVSFLPAASNVIPNTNNTGNATIQASLANTNLLTTSNYRFDVLTPPVPPGSDSYVLTRLSDGKQWNITGTEWANPPVDQYFSDGMDGLRLSQPAGTVKAGDSYLIQPTQGFATNMSVQITDPAKIAAGYSIKTNGDTALVTTNAGVANTGTGAITNTTSVIDASGGVNAKPIDLVFTAPGTYNIVDHATGSPLLSNQAYVAGNPITYNGWTVSITGAPAAGDTFAVAPKVNTGSGQISAGAPSGSPLNINLLNQQGALPSTISSVGIHFTSPTQFDIIDPTKPAPGNVLVGGQTYTTGQSITYNGWSASLTGVPNTNDTFMLIQSNTGGVSDSRNILAMGQLQTANTIANGSANYQGAYSQMVANVGVQANQVNINQSAQAQLLQQSQTKLAETSGVNLDEEASNLLIFQQAYLAASKTIQVSQQAFQSILAIGG